MNVGNLPHGVSLSVGGSDWLDTCLGTPPCSNRHHLDSAIALAPSRGTPAEIDALKAAVAKSVTVVQTTRVGSGRTARVLNHIERS